MLKHKIGLEKIIKKRISQGSGYMDILKNIYGADPREVWDIYKKYKKETPQKIGLKNLYPNLPEPHPAYSQWRITPNSTKIILSKLAEKKYQNICFLGCPVLGTEFSKLRLGATTLFDIDKDVLKYAKKNTRVQPYNIIQEIPKKNKNKFECVVCDPPWYADDIKLFIKRASELTKIGGTIYFSLPDLLTKPSIPDERINLQKWLSDNGLIIAELWPLVEYEVPPFEYMAYHDIPSFSGKPWRKGDWVKLKKSKNQKIYFKPASNYPSWTEYSFGKKRIFVKNNGKIQKYEKPKLNSLCANDILRSVSKRNPLIPKIDIWTSRNAVLGVANGLGVIKTIMENIQKDTDKIIQKISKKYRQNEKKVSSDCFNVIEVLKKIIKI